MIGFVRMLCSFPLAWLFVVSLAQGMEAPDGGKTVKLFADEAWYKQHPGEEQAFEGMLEKVDRGGAFGFGRFNPFRLTLKDDTREVYMGGQLRTLEPFVGKRIRLRGKAVEIGVEGKRHREIWPAELVVLATVAEDSEAEGATAVALAIKDLLAGKRGIEDTRLDVTWGGRGSATIYGIGVGIWNRERQFKLDNAQLLALLKILNEGGFAKMRPGYGGIARPLRGPAIGAPEVLVGSVTLHVGNLTQGSMQRGGGEQSRELAAIANNILDLCEKAAQNGVAADSLADGLKKIAAGKLHPLTMSLLVQRIENEGRGPNGWILRIHGQQAEVQLRSRTGIGSPIRFELTAMQLDGLCKLLIDNDAGSLPVNLYAPDYTDFRVSILRRDKSLQARKFARLTPTTHGEKQKQFDRIFAGLDALHQRIIKEGRRDGDNMR